MCLFSFVSSSEIRHEGEGGNGVEGGGGGEPTWSCHAHTEGHTGALWLIALPYTVAAASARTVGALDCYLHFHKLPRKLCA